MGNSNYQSGTRYERKAMEKLEEAGYETMRTAGSHGIFDILAVGPSVRLIQHKSFEEGNDWQREYEEAVEKIRPLKKLDGVTYEVWVWKKYNGYIKQEVIK